MKSMARKVTTRMKIARDMTNLWKKSNESYYFAPKIIIWVIIFFALLMSALAIIGN